MDDVRIFERKPNPATDREVFFSLRNTPQLEQGTIYDPLATAENLWVNLKVYASGGENALHSHAGEDHAFIILQGKATFTFVDGSTAGPVAAGQACEAESLSALEAFQIEIVPKGGRAAKPAAKPARATKPVASRR